jgi:hypothetical protein
MMLLVREGRCPPRAPLARNGHSLIRRLGTVTAILDNDVIK